MGNPSSITISNFGLELGTNRTMYAKWSSWQDVNQIEGYQVRWWYANPNGVGLLGSDTTVEHGNSTYTAPENATKVTFQVRAISKTYKVDDTDVQYFSEGWAENKSYYFADNPTVEKPPVPTVEINGYTLTATVDNVTYQNPDGTINTTHIEFQVVKDNSAQLEKENYRVEVKTRRAVLSKKVPAGSVYKVRCCGLRKNGNDYIPGVWTDYSENVSTPPAASKGITTLKAKSTTSVYLKWGKASAATTYDIEYATKKEYLGKSNASTTLNSIETNEYIITGLETGSKYFFRVRAVNEQGESAWTEVKSITIGKAPAAPTTRSSTTTAIVGEPLTLFWTHNSVDGSRQSKAEIEVYFGSTKKTYTIDDSGNDDDEYTEDVTQYKIDTSKYTDGTTIRWRVRTAGITGTYSDWSVQRTIDIYAPPTLQLSIRDASNNVVEKIRSFPFNISAIAGPNTQTPLSYHVAVVSGSSYETVDRSGNPKIVSRGETIYSEHYDISKPLYDTMSADKLSLVNNVMYTVTCTVSMDSGLTAEASASFTVIWEPSSAMPNASIGINTDDFTAYIMPYCRYYTGGLVDNVTLAVYRIEFDGSLTELATGLMNWDGIYVVDPHPALDYARYRIVSTSMTTSTVRHYDLPPYPVGGKAVIIQWAEEWSNFGNPEGAPYEEPVWTGSMLKLPYNIDVSDSNQADVALIEYIGREHPVSYYGTQIGVSSVWNVEIPKDDKETLYALRRLSRWMGDVYVREPSGSGYWANINVSFSQKHCEKTIPVTFNIKRVEGGV